MTVIVFFNDSRVQIHFYNFQLPWKEGTLFLISRLEKMKEWKAKKFSFENIFRFLMEILAIHNINIFVGVLK